MKRALKIQNAKFTLKAKYGEKVIDAAEVAWSQFNGPCYDKIYLSKLFEVYCWCIRFGMQLKAEEDGKEMM